MISDNQTGNESGVWKQQREDSELQGLKIADTEEMLELVDLQRLLVLKNSKSYTEAAYRLSLSEAHLRRRVQYLEKVVGFKLIERKVDRTLGLTEDGKLWLRSLDELRHSLDALDVTINEAIYHGENLKLGVNPDLMFSTVLSEILNTKANILGKLRLDLHAGCRDTQLLEGECEALICIHPSSHHELSSRLLCRVPITFYHANESRDDISTTSDPLNVILYSTIKEEQALLLLRRIPAFSDRNYHFIHAADIVEAMQMAILNNGVVPTIHQRKVITATNLRVHQCKETGEIPLYLITLKSTPCDDLFWEFKNNSQRYISTLLLEIHELKY